MRLCGVAALPVQSGGSLGGSQFTVKFQKFPSFRFLPVFLPALHGILAGVMLPALVRLAAGLAVRLSVCGGAVRCSLADAAAIQGDGLGGGLACWQAIRFAAVQCVGRACGWADVLPVLTACGAGAGYVRSDK